MQNGMFGYDISIRTNNHNETKRTITTPTNSQFFSCLPIVIITIDKLKNQPL